jgi:hypothetical protein
MFEEAAFVDFLLHSEASNLVTLYPAVSEAAAADHVPIGLRQVSRRTAGFAHNSERRNKWIGWDGEIRWDGVLRSDYLQDADSNLWHMDIGHDGCGNRWVLLMEPGSGSPAQVLWASHDAPVTVVAEDSLDEFCRRIITDTESFLEHIGNCEHEIWKSKPQGISLEEARASTDQVIREVADGLDDSWRVFDARPEQKMRGFVRLAIDGIRKHETEPVFALKDGDIQRTKPRWKLW